MKIQTDRRTNRLYCCKQGIVSWCKSMTDLDLWGRVRRRLGRGRAALVAVDEWKYRKANFSVVRAKFYFCK